MLRQRRAALDESCARQVEPKPRIGTTVAVQDIGTNKRAQGRRRRRRIVLTAKLPEAEREHGSELEQQVANHIKLQIVDYLTLSERSARDSCCRC